MMHTQKVAITMPAMLIKKIDDISKKKGLSRSRYIALAVSEKIEDEQRRSITACYNEIFSDMDIQKEQLETAGCFESVGSEGGQEW